MEIRSEQYEKSFLSAIKRLLNNTYVVRDIKEDEKDYEFIFTAQPDIEEYLERMGVKLVNYGQGIFGIEAQEGDCALTKIGLNRTELAVYVVLRDAYIKNGDMLSATAKITRKDLLIQLGEYINAEKFKKTHYKNVLAKFNRHRLIKQPKSVDIYREDSEIILYPTLVLSADDEKVKQYFEKAMSQLIVVF